MNGKFETLTPAELKLLEKLSPDMYAAVQAGKPNAELVARVFLATKKAAARNAADQASSPPQPPSNPPPPAVQLPPWPEPVRAVPNGILRSALFGAIRKGKRRYMEHEQVASVDGVNIFYTGQRLDQGDLDVWETVLHILRNENLGKEFRITSYALLRAMGKNNTGDNRKILHKRITRLRANAVEIKQGRYVYIGGLIDTAFKNEETQKWVISLNPHLHSLFTHDQFTQIDWDIRNELDGQLSKWLHGFYSSHAAPYPIKIETLRKLSGSETGELKKFTQQLKIALDSIKTTCAAHGQIFDWSISDGLVFVTKTPSRAQRRHLTQHGK